MHRPFGEIKVDFIGRDAFVRNKRATGRAKDIADIEGLSQLRAWGGADLTAAVRAIMLWV